MNKEEHIHIRSTSDEKKKIGETAASLHLSITECILLRCRDLPLRDKEGERKLYEAMMELTGEMNYIGNNINQAVTAIHKLKFTGGSGEECLGTFNALFSQYISSRQKLADLLEKAVQ